MNKLYSANNVDVDALLDGFDASDWSDMHDDFISPPIITPEPHYLPQSCTRCTVQQVSTIDLYKVLQFSLLSPSH